MKSSLANSGRIVRCGLAVLIALSAFATLPLLSRAHPAPQAASITVVNNSNWEIRYLYLSPADSDNWGGDQMNGSTLTPGASVTLSNVQCPGAEIKVVSEDMDGCFISKVLACSEGAQWTITNDARPNCGN
jgi:hypothetical protein